MACVENITAMNVDSEMEEGEIVDDLSDISSEEEYLLRERLAVLENYNNVLERKKAKRAFVGPGVKTQREDALSHDLSEISATEFEEYCSPYKIQKIQKHQKPHHRPKRRKVDTTSAFQRFRESKKKNSSSKRKPEVKASRESSEESEDDYKNSRKKLAEAVVVNKENNDKTSLSVRLQKMLRDINPEPIKLLINENRIHPHIISNRIESPPKLLLVASQATDEKLHNLKTQDDILETRDTCAVVDICNVEENRTIVTFISSDTVDSGMLGAEDNKKTIDNEMNFDKDSDEDLELLRLDALKTKLHTVNNLEALKLNTLQTKLINVDDDLEMLRQHALKSKAMKVKKPQIDVTPISEIKNISEDEDSDTTELRLICLKSALIKKAIEMKRKQKLQKRLSQSSNTQEESLEHAMLADRMHSDNNTDIESVDMDIGSDGDDKVKETVADYVKDTSNGHDMEVPAKHIPVLMVSQEDELEEDEDLLRTKLLTSLTKNLPNLVDPNIIKSNELVTDTKCVMPKESQPTTILEEKRFIINVESDSEGENEATMNLTKMHMKLSEQKDFQHKLDMFLKSTRLEVENTSLPDAQDPIVQTPKKNEKYVAKAVNNLPKSEQIEYKYLVKRMAELEKLKQARQVHISLPKDTLKPKNITINTTHLSAINNLEEKIKLSRKNIAEESAKMLKLKDEGVKLSQKFKIVATELRNIKTALALNKKQQRTVQNCLAKIRLHHQTLLKSSLSSTHSKVNAIHPLNNTELILQKENNPKGLTTSLSKETSKDNRKMLVNQKTAKIDFTKEQKQSNSIKSKALAIQHPRLSIEIDVTSNKKVVTLSNDDEKNDKNKYNRNDIRFDNKMHSSNPVVEKGGGIETNGVVPGNPKQSDSDDYKSPLDAFGSSTWSEDPNAILCPFEVCGDCKDADCKYLHTNTPSK